MDTPFNFYGIWSGVKKAVKVALWVAVSGAVAALAAKTQSFTIEPGQVYELAAVALANSILAGIVTYLKTNEPDFNISLPTLFKKKEQSEPTEHPIAV